MPENRKITGMVVTPRGEVFVSTEASVFRLYDGKLREIPFVTQSETPSR